MELPKNRVGYNSHGVWSTLGDIRYEARALTAEFFAQLLSNGGPWWFVIALIYSTGTQNFEHKSELELHRRTSRGIYWCSLFNSMGYAEMDLGLRLECLKSAARRIELDEFWLWQSL